MMAKEATYEFKDGTRVTVRGSGEWKIKVKDEEVVLSAEREAS